MQSIDVGSIVPSTRDLLQVLATRRRSMALVAHIDGERPAEEAARLHELNVSAFAFSEPGPSMQLVARATKTVPSLCLLAAGDREAFLAARYFGADGVCIGADVGPDEWDKLAKGARTTRMLPLAIASTVEAVAAAAAAGARVILLRAPTASEVCVLADAAPKAATLVADVEGADAEALRALRGRVDAAIIPSRVHTAASFAALVAELDP